MGKDHRMPGIETLREDKRHLGLQRSRPPGVGIGYALLHSTGTSIPHNTVAVMSWNQEDHDPYGMHSTSTNANRITAVCEGYYAVGGTMSVGAASPAGWVQLHLRANGSDDVAVHRQTFLNPSFVTISSYIELAVGDYVELLASQATGATQTTNTTYDRFWAHRLS